MGGGDKRLVAYHTAVGNPHRLFVALNKIYIDIID
jgi:hypothetical protein